MTEQQIAELKPYLDSLVLRFNTPDFIADDPVSVPHLFESREDREISGFLASTIAWGNRKAIVKNCHRLMRMLDMEPYRVVMESSQGEKLHLCDFVHRTFNGQDCLYFIDSLKNIYENHGGIGVFFEKEYEKSRDMRHVLAAFWKLFFSLPHERRVEKHLSSIEKKAACKRLNMYIKWMVRRDEGGVDLGIWDKIPASAIYMPLDVHSGNVGRALGLLERRQNDWRAVEEITDNLRLIDPSDPVKYDFALFGAGINKVI